MNLTLRPLAVGDEAAFLAGWRDWEGESADWYSFIWQPGMSYAAMLEILRNEEAGVDLAPDWVPHTMLYAFFEGKIVGRVSVRHRLNERLRVRGGHMGYAVAPQYRRRGFATEMVRQALGFCAGLGISRIMLTCAAGNIPSRRVIEHAGGKLAEEIWSGDEKETICRYWIELA